MLKLELLLNFILLFRKLLLPEAIISLVQLEPREGANQFCEQPIDAI